MSIGRMRASSGTAISPSPKPNVDRIKVAKNTTSRTCSVAIPLVLGLLLQLQNQLFPLGGKRGVLLAQVLQQPRDALRLFRALVDAKRFFRACDRALNPRNLFFDKTAALMHLAQL